MLRKKGKDSQKNNKKGTHTHTHTQRKLRHSKFMGPKQLLLTAQVLERLTPSRTQASLPGSTHQLLQCDHAAWLLAPPKDAPQRPLTIRRAGGEDRWGQGPVNARAGLGVHTSLTVHSALCSFKGNSPGASVWSPGGISSSEAGASEVNEKVNEGAV